MNRPRLRNIGISVDLFLLLRRMKAKARRYLKCIACYKARTRTEAVILLGNLDCICLACYVGDGD